MMTYIPGKHAESKSGRTGNPNQDWKAVAAKLAALWIETMKIVSPIAKRLKSNVENLFLETVWKQGKTKLRIKTCCVKKMFSLNYKPSIQVSDHFLHS